MISCTATEPASYQTVLVLDAVTYYCDTTSPPLVVLEQGGMTLEEFNTLWPLLLGLMVTGFLVQQLRRVF
jgi:hypothetical protein